MRIGMNVCYFFQGRQPWGHQMKVFQTQPCSLSGRFLQKIESNLHLTLTHGDLNTIEIDRAASMGGQ